MFFTIENFEKGLLKIIHVEGGDSTNGCVVYHINGCKSNLVIFHKNGLQD